MCTNRSCWQKAKVLTQVLRTYMYITPIDPVARNKKKIDTSPTSIHVHELILLAKSKSLDTRPLSIHVHESILSAETKRFDTGPAGIHVYTKGSAQDAPLRHLRKKIAEGARKPKEMGPRARRIFLNKRRGNPTSAT